MNIVDFLRALTVRTGKPLIFALVIVLITGVLSATLIGMVYLITLLGAFWGIVLLTAIWVTVIAVFGWKAIHDVLKGIMNGSKSEAAYVANRRKVRNVARQTLATARTNADNAEAKASELADIAAQARMEHLNAVARNGDVAGTVAARYQARVEAGSASERADERRVEAIQAEDALEAASTALRNARADFRSDVDTTDTKVVDLPVTG